MHASTPSNFGIIFQNDIFELKLCKHDKSMVIAEKALSKNGEDGLAIVLESDESDMSNSRSHVICIGRYDIIYRQIKMVDGHSLGGLRVRTRSQNSSVTDHGF